MRLVAIFLNKSGRMSDMMLSCAICMTSTSRRTICCSKGLHLPEAVVESFLGFCRPSTWFTRSLLKEEQSRKEYEIHQFCSSFCLIKTRNSDPLHLKFLKRTCYPPVKNGQDSPLPPPPIFEDINTDPLKAELRVLSLFYSIIGTIFANFPLKRTCPSGRLLTPSLPYLYGCDSRYLISCG